MADATPVTGRLVHDDDIDWYQIDGIEAMPPFLVSVVSSTDLWMFTSSRGTLTAGRRDADLALLPYDTDDRLHRAAGVTGPVTLLTRTVQGQRELWQPFGPDPVATGRRSLAKAVVGDRLRLEEVHPGWGLRHRTTWSPAPTLGWVRDVDVFNEGDQAFELDVLDGLLDIMPPGVDATIERRSSNLIDAYKRAETGPWGSAAVYALQAGITDRAEPSESLAATLVWAVGAEFATVHLDEAVIAAMHRGDDAEPTRLLTGRQAAYLLRGPVQIPSGGSVSWRMVADIGLPRPALEARISLAAQPGATAQVDADIARGANRLRLLLADADGDQQTGEPIADAHHRSNVLFNTMRGGLPIDGHHVDGALVAAHVATRNRAVHEAHGTTITGMGGGVDVADLHALADAAGDPDLRRLVLEHLPLTFSRRHGDPSRPWNSFQVPVGDEAGQSAVEYEGNWRDIFQNWEALLHSYPAWTPHVIAVFVNASTADGHNPYRISQDGIDWEVPEPEDPWSNIGYWGDHQIVYLHRLLSLWRRLDPDAIHRRLADPIFTYADVPYTLAGHEAIVADPRETITYDESRARQIAARVDAIGTDGRLLVRGNGDIVRVGLLEKLLVPLLAKLCTFVPGGGIWMVTQRPEWNDANNALAGWGLSMVTLYHLHAYVVWLDELLAEVEEHTTPLSGPVARWFDAVAAAVAGIDANAHRDDCTRRVALDALGRAGANHRAQARQQFDPTPTAVEVAQLRAGLADARTHLRRTIDEARREDGLYHAYRILALPDATSATVSNLDLMLEGQVAALSSGAVDPAEALSVVDALYRSSLYRADQDSFVLYPVAQPPGVMGTNNFRRDEFTAIAPIAPLIQAGVLLTGEGDAVHVAPGIVNAAALRDALAGTPLDDGQVDALVVVYNRSFGHDCYLGRSGSMYGYEGIGSIYWHMVAKLLVAVQEIHRDARNDGAAQDVVDDLARAYRRIRDGLGFRKSPEVFGAVPIDCYSHTPAHAGAQQPGMTGQVKEEVLTRFGELGVEVTGGRLAVRPSLLPQEDLLPDRGNGEARITVCGTPFLLRAGSAPGFRTRQGGDWGPFVQGDTLDEDTSRRILARDGTIRAVEISVPR